MRKCTHGFEQACLTCGFSLLDGKRVWQDWVCQAQHDRIAELEVMVKDWKSKSVPMILNGACVCGEPLQAVVSDRENYSLLHCFGCGKTKYELIKA